jgi:hypothetical protein
MYYNIYNIMSFFALAKQRSSELENIERPLKMPKFDTQFRGQPVDLAKYHEQLTRGKIAQESQNIPLQQHNKTYHSEYLQSNYLKGQNESYDLRSKLLQDRMTQLTTKYEQPMSKSLLSTSENKTVISMNDELNTFIQKIESGVFDLTMISDLYKLYNNVKSQSYLFSDELLNVYINRFTDIQNALELDETADVVRKYSQKDSSVLNLMTEIVKSCLQLLEKMSNAIKKGINQSERKEILKQDISIKNYKKVETSFLKDLSKEIKDLDDKKAKAKTKKDSEKFALLQKQLEELSKITEFNRITMNPEQKALVEQDQLKKQREEIARAEALRASEDLKRKAEEEEARLERLALEEEERERQRQEEEERRQKEEERRQRAEDAQKISDIMEVIKEIQKEEESVKKANESIKSKSDNIMIQFGKLNADYAKFSKERGEIMKSIQAKADELKKRFPELEDKDLNSYVRIVIYGDEKGVTPPELNEDARTSLNAFLEPYSAIEAKIINVQNLMQTQSNENKVLNQQSEENTNKLKQLKEEKLDYLQDTIETLTEEILKLDDEYNKLSKIFDEQKLRKDGSHLATDKKLVKLSNRMSVLDNKVNALKSEYEKTTREGTDILLDDLVFSLGVPEGKDDEEGEVKEAEKPVSGKVYDTGIKKDKVKFDGVEFPREYNKFINKAKTNPTEFKQKISPLLKRFGISPPATLLGTTKIDEWLNYVFDQLSTNTSIVTTEGNQIFFKEADKPKKKPKKKS